MTGLFTYRNFSVEDTPSLDGKVAVVTGGQGGIGREITAQLLLHKIKKVFVLARNKIKYEAALEEWRRRGIFLGKNDDRLEFILCDLGDIPSARKAAGRIKRKTDSLDIVICNADPGLGVSSIYDRSAQNIEMVFAANCVGHQILVTILLPLLKDTTIKTSSNDARIVVTSSSMHSCCRRLDLDLLTASSPPKSRFIDGIWRYGRSKLGNILFTKELTRRLREGRDPAHKNIYVNSFFPGNIITEQWGAWDSIFGGPFGAIMRAVFFVIGQSQEDGAATAMFLAASREVREENRYGQYLIPIAKSYTPTNVSRDEKLAGDLWDWIDSKVTETLGSNWQDETGDGLGKTDSDFP